MPTRKVLNIFPYKMRDEGERERERERSFFLKKICMRLLLAVAL